MMLRLALVLIALLGPLAFPLSSAGYLSLHALAFVLVVPSSLVLLAAVPGLYGRRPDVSALLWRGLLSGAVATFALEAVRYPGFRLGFMPGNLPRLMGVLLLGRFALGPSAWSDLAGFTYHYWNGAAFGAVLVLLFGGRAARRAVPYAVAVGLGFLASPVVTALGGGFMGLALGAAFVGTVMTAHLAFGLALAGMLTVLHIKDVPAGSVFAGALRRGRGGERVAGR